ncbi:MAG: tetratricopeptide repeat protein [Candidatus Sericytochromatia bacterium]
MDTLWEIIVFIAVIYFSRIFVINLLFNYAEKNEKLDKYDKALFYYKYLALLKPKEFLYDIYNSIGNCFSELKEYENALVYYQKAIDLNPDNYIAFKNAGINFIDQGDYQNAHRFFSTSLRLKHGIPYNEDSNQLEHYITPPNIEIITSVAKLKHDIEQMDYLITKGLLPEIYEDKKLDLEYLYQYIKNNHESSFFITIKDDKRAYIDTIYERNIYLYESEYQEKCINDELDFKEITKEFTTKKITYFDDFLTEEFLAEVRFFCLNSTIWHEYNRVWGYLASNMDNGLSNPIFYKLAEELRANFPDIIKDYKLMNMWAFKYDSTMKGVSVHADEAIVNVNFWITSDEANLNPNSGGLAVYGIEAPINWSYEAYNSDETGIYNFIKENNAEKIIIPHKANRCVIFNSALFHETDKFNFKEGYENRRINITLLFGKRK